MCRLYGFLANEPTKVDCSLVFAQNALMQQSRVDRVGIDHTDGWGIVTYQDGIPVITKKTTAAYEDLQFSTTAEKAYSTAIIAHIRRATVGQNSIYNTHPFVSGRWTFAHNGTITGFDQLEPEMVAETYPELQRQRLGQTDSEQYFLWLLSRIHELGFDESSINSADHELVDILTQHISGLAKRCQSLNSEKIPRLNFLLTNGEILIACRWNHSLFMIERQGLYECEICGIPHIHHHETVNHRAVAIASEPITHDDWSPVEDHSLLMVSNEFQTIGV